MRRTEFVFGLAFFGWTWAFAIAVAAAQETESAPTQVTDLLRANREAFQQLEIIPNRTAAWIFQVGSAPRLVWRDVDEARRLGGDANFLIRWFDRSLNEVAQPNAAGRWMAWVEGKSPNGTPLRRAFTFFVLPEKVEPEFVPDLTVAFPNFPGPKAPTAWIEHQWEFDRAARDFLFRGLLDNEAGAILVAGISEAPPLGRPARHVESTEIANSECHLRLKLKLLNLANNVRSLCPPQPINPPATVLREGTADEANLQAAAKSKIDAICREWVAATGEPFVTLVAQRGVIITHEAFGNAADGKPITKDYRCWIASLTKTVTALMFSQFVDQGLINLDARLSTVFPDYLSQGEHVPTFRQCLNHTSGLKGHGEFGGMRNPHLENIVLNALDLNEPGKAHSYCGLGYELVAKAMEIVSGQAAAQVYDQHLFRPLGFGDVILGNASSDAELTAAELAILGQWLVNRGAYGDLRYISEATFAELLPKPLNVPGAIDDHGLGLHWVYHRWPGAPGDSRKPEHLVFSPRTIGHGSFSGCILVVDLDRQIVIAQARREFKDQDSEWYTKFFQTIGAALRD